MNILSEITSSPKTLFAFDNARILNSRETLHNMETKSFIEPSPELQGEKQPPIDSISENSSWLVRSRRPERRKSIGTARICMTTNANPTSSGKQGNANEYGRPNVTREPPDTHRRNYTKTLHLVLQSDISSKQVTWLGREICYLTRWMIFQDWELA